MKNKIIYKTNYDFTFVIIIPIQNHKKANTNDNGKRKTCVCDGFGLWIRGHKLLYLLELLVAQRRVIEDWNYNYIYIFYVSVCKCKEAIWITIKYKDKYGMKNIYI